MFSRLAAKQRDKSQLMRPPICCAVVKQIHTDMSDPNALSQRRENSRKGKSAAVSVHDYPDQRRCWK